jgi:hypothetical protein
MLKLRPIGVNDYTVLKGEQRIGRIRYAEERAPGIWLWQVDVHRSIRRRTLGRGKPRRGSKMHDGLQGSAHARAAGGGLCGHEHSRRAGPPNPAAATVQLKRSPMSGIKLWK